MIRCGDRHWGAPGPCDLEAGHHSDHGCRRGNRRTAKRRGRSLWWIPWVDPEDDTRVRWTNWRVHNHDKKNKE